MKWIGTAQVTGALVRSRTQRPYGKAETKVPGTSGLPRSLVKLRGRREPAGAAMVESTERAPNPVRARDEVDDGAVLALDADGAGQPGGGRCGRRGQATTPGKTNQRGASFRQARATAGTVVAAVQEPSRHIEAVVELSGIEPLTSSLRTTRSPN